MTVLILAPELDLSADRMVEELRHREVPVFRADTAWFPAHLKIDARLDGGHWAGRLSVGCRSVELQEIRAVWFRTPSTFSFPDTLSPTERQHAFLEAKFGVGGALGSLDVRWVNHPNRAAAAYKPIQLATAARCGMDVPATVITNVPQAVREFADRCGAGRMITKMLGANHIEEEGVRRIAFTRVVPEADILDLRGVDATAHQVQECVRKAHEARVIMIGDRVFAFSIHAGNKESFVDFRADYGALTYRTTDVPPTVAAAVRQFMRRMGLLYGALDFVVTPTGRWVFLECNPGGQYGWLESKTGVPLTAALADLLAGAAN